MICRYTTSTDYCKVIPFVFHSISVKYPQSAWVSPHCILHCYVACNYCVLALNCEGAFNSACRHSSCTLTIKKNNNNYNNERENEKIYNTVEPRFADTPLRWDSFLGHCGKLKHFLNLLRNPFKIRTTDTFFSPNLHIPI